MTDDHRVWQPQVCLQRQVVEVHVLISVHVCVIGNRRERVYVRLKPSACVARMYDVMERCACAYKQRTRFYAYKCRAGDVMCVFIFVQRTRMWVRLYVCMCVCLWCRMCIVAYSQARLRVI